MSSAVQPTRAYSFTTTPAPWWRLVALLGLLGYLTAGSGLGASLVTVIASRDTQHVVRISAGEREVRIVLHHNGARRDQIASHHHGTPARLLTLLATPSRVQGDHVMTFSSPAKARSENTSLTPPASPTIATVPDWPSAEISVPSIANHSAPFTRPPPASITSSHTVVRATIFLI